MSNLDQSDIMQLAGEGKAAELRDILREKCFAENGGLYFFTKVVLGYKELVPHFHMEFCNHVQNSIHLLKRGYLLPRGHFKSTIVSKSYPIWRLCGGGKQVGFDPRNLRICIVGESDTVAKKNLRDIAYNIQNNQMLRWLFPEIIPADFNKVTWKEDELEINRSKSYDEPSIKSVGIGAKSTGFHYDIIIYDDPIGEKAAKSEAEMNSAKNWFDLAPGLANDQHTMEELIAGTRWLNGKADLYGYIMQELAFTEESGRPFGFTWYIRSCYDENGEVRFWPRFDKEILQNILKREKMYKFSCQYLNAPTAPEGSKFPESMLKLFKVGTGPDGKRDLLIPLDGTPPVKLSHLARISFYDPSSGGQHAGSENAIAGVGQAADGRKFVFKVWSKTCGFRPAIERWFEFNDQFGTWPNYFEGIGPHKEVGELVRERQIESKCKLCNKRHRRLSPEMITPVGGSASKFDRILTFAQADIEDGNVYFDTNDVKTLAQIVSFPYGDLLDRFDAVAYGLHYVKRPKAFEDVEAEEHDRQQKQQAKQQRTAQAYEVGGYC